MIAAKAAGSAALVVLVERALGSWEDSAGCAARSGPGCPECTTEP